MTSIADTTKAVALLVALLTTVNAFGDDYEKYEQAVQAYAQGHYKKAYELFLPLAKTGDADAQFHLGLMYDNGLGVEQDHAIAEQWYNRACPLPDTETPAESTREQGGLESEQRRYDDEIQHYHQERVRSGKEGL